VILYPVAVLWFTTFTIPCNSGVVNTVLATTARITGSQDWPSAA